MYKRSRDGQASQVSSVSECGEELSCCLVRQPQVLSRAELLRCLFQRRECQYLCVCLEDPMSKEFSPRGGHSLPFIRQGRENSTIEREFHALRCSGHRGPVQTCRPRPPPLRPGSSCRAVCGAGNVEGPPLRRSMPPTLRPILS